MVSLHLTLSHWNSELADPATLASQLAPGIPLPLPENIWTTILSRHLHILDIKDLNYTAITSSTKLSPSSVVILPKAMGRFSAILIKILMTFFTELKKKALLKLKCKHKRQMAKATLSKKNTARGITKPGFKPHYRALMTMASTDTKTD